MIMMDNVMALVNVYNSDEYLEYVLKSIYDFPAKIVIIDGAFDKKMPSKYSTDGTRKIVETFPDPDGKIIYERTSSETQNEQRSKGLKYLQEGQWLFIVDDDEIYKPKDLKNLKKFLENDAKKDNYSIGSYTFLGSFDWCRYITSPRLFRWKPGMAFIGSNNLTWYYGKEKYKGILTIPAVLRYHYSYVRNNNRLDIRKIQTSHNNYPYEKHGKFFTRKDIFPIEFDPKETHPEIMKDHPYAKIKWHPTDSDMQVGPRVKPKIIDPQEKKEVLAWDEYYKPFHKEDYEEHIGAWKGICHIIARMAPDEGGRLLEVGSGTGMMSIYLSKMEPQNFYCVGFDNNPKQVDRSKVLSLEMAAGAKFACRDLFSLDLKKVGVYHIVHSQGLLEHFTNQQIKEALEVMLKIGRIVVFSVPIDKFPHKSRGDERLLSDSFWRRQVSKYQLLHFSMFAKDTQIIVAIRRRFKTFEDNLRWKK